jgi:hypothetical protein
MMPFVLQYKSATQGRCYVFCSWYNNIIVNYFLELLYRPKDKFLPFLRQ